MSSVEDLREEVLKLAKKQLQVYKNLYGTKCKHEWELISVKSITFEPLERKCNLCGEIQKSTLTWTKSK